MSSNIFKLVNFSPVGFKQINYPTAYCLLCRGYLTEICDSCTKYNRDECHVLEKDGSYYHMHCYNIIARKNDKTKKK